MVRELGFEMKAPPSNRMKTEEELAQEERERLKCLEVSRGRGGGRGRGRGRAALGSCYYQKGPLHLVVFSGLEVCCVLPVKSF